MDSTVIIIIVLCVCVCLIVSSVIGAYLYTRKPAEETSSGKVSALPEWMRKYIDEDGTSCQDITNKYGVYPGFHDQYIPQGDDMTKYILADCKSKKLWPANNISVSNLYSIRGDDSYKGFPYVGKDSQLAEIANTNGKVYANVQPGPKLCTYIDGVRDTCTSGTVMPGTFSMFFDKYANFCMGETSNQNNVAWCAFPRIVDIPTAYTDTYSNTASYVHAKHQLYNGGTYTEVDNSHRHAALLPGGKICVYDNTPGTAPGVALWCNK